VCENDKSVTRSRGLTPPDAARTLSERIAAAQLQVIAGAGHLSNMERPDAFNAAVQAFLDELSWH
jgi:pimeloyl-ACP methyl ester carboxylesterase